MISRKKPCDITEKTVISRRVNGKIFETVAQNDEKSCDITAASVCDNTGKNSWALTLIWQFCAGAVTIGPVWAFLCSGGYHRPCLGIFLCRGRDHPPRGSHVACLTAKRNAEEFLVHQLSPCSNSPSTKRDSNSLCLAQTSQ